MTMLRFLHFFLHIYMYVAFCNEYSFMFLFCLFVVSRKMHECRKSLEENLFILHPQLSPALLEVRGQCEADYEKKLMLAIEAGTTYTLDEFRDCHMGKMGLVRAPTALKFTLTDSVHYRERWGP